MTLGLAALASVARPGSWSKVSACVGRLLALLTVLMSPRLLPGKMSMLGAVLGIVLQDGAA